MHRDGAVTVAVSTGGLSPALASWLRDRLRAACGNDVGTLARILGEARARLRSEGRPIDDVDWAALLEGPLPSLVASGALDAAVALLDDAVHA